MLIGCQGGRASGVWEEGVPDADWVWWCCCKVASGWVWLVVTAEGRLEQEEQHNKNTTTTQTS